MDDALAMDNLKTLKVTDQAGSLTLQAAEQLEDAGVGCSRFGAFSDRERGERRHPEPGGGPEVARRRVAAGGCASGSRELAAQTGRGLRRAVGQPGDQPAEAQVKDDGAEI